MKVLITLVLFVVAFVNIDSCSNAKREYENYVASQNGMGAFVEGFADGYTGTTTFLESAQIRERELADAKNKSFHWACGWTVMAVIVVLVNVLKKKTLSATGLLLAPVLISALIIGCGRNESQNNSSASIATSPRQGSKENLGEGILGWRLGDRVSESSGLVCFHEIVGPNGEGSGHHNFWKCSVRAKNLSPDFESFDGAEVTLYLTPDRRIYSIATLGQMSGPVTRQSLLARFTKAYGHPHDPVRSDQTVAIFGDEHRVVSYDMQTGSFISCTDLDLKHEAMQHATPEEQKEFKEQADMDERLFGAER